MDYKKPHIPKFRRLASYLRKRANDIALTHVEAFAEHEAEGFRQSILRQDFRSFHAFPLKPVTLARKRRAGVDLRVMIATHTYVDSIRVFRTLNRTAPKGARFRIGFHPKKRARDYEGRITDILLSDVAMIHEHGSVSASIPARPHWGPHRVGMVRRAVGVRQAIKKQVLAVVKRELRKVL